MKNIKQRLIRMPLMIVAITVILSIALNTILYLFGVEREWLLIAKTMGKFLLAVVIGYMALCLIVGILAWGYEKRKRRNAVSAAKSSLLRSLLQR